MTDGSAEEQNKQKRWRTLGSRAVWLVSVLTVILTTAVMIFFVRFGEGSVYELEEGAVDGHYEATISPQNRELLQELERQQSYLNSTFEIQINGAPRADAASGRCGLMAANPEGNEQNVRITVTLDESGETIYQSPVLKPGERLAYVTLDWMPEPGEYAATAEFTVLDLETGTINGVVDAGILLTVN